MDMGEHDPESEGRGREAGRPARKTVRKRRREAGRQSEGEGAVPTQGEKIKARRER